jgi:hypothetical protein
VDKVYKAVGVLISVDQMGESNFRIELEEVWVPKDVGELEGLLLTIQNEPSKKILKHKIQQILEERDRRRTYWNENWGDDDTGWHNGWEDGADWDKDWEDSGDWGTDNWFDSR